MMRFVYLGPPDEPEVTGTFQGLTGEWFVGVPRDIADPAHIAWLARHPHWAAMEGDAFVDPPGVDDLPPAPPKRGPGRPRK